MVVYLLERVSPSLRGEISRWLLELRPGVFIGNISAMVRDKLWEIIQDKAPEQAGWLIHSARTEQGFIIKTYGDTSRKVVDYEGIVLVKRLEKRRK